MNVAIVSAHDYANSGHNIAGAVNRAGKKHGVSARTVVIGGHPFGYVRDVQVSVNPEEAKKIINKADIIHFKDHFEQNLKGPDHVILDHIGDIKIPPDTPKIWTFGGDALRYDDLKEQVIGLLDTDSSVEEFTVLSSEYDVSFLRNVRPTHYIGYSVDAKKFPQREERNKKLTIGHYAGKGRAKVKGSDAVWDALDKFDVNIERRGDEVIPYKECIARKYKCDIYIDQLVLGVYGNSAVESMCMGIPTIAYLSDVAIENAGGILDDCPIVNVPNDALKLRFALQELIWDGQKRWQIGNTSRKWIIRHQGFISTGKKYLDIYKGIV